MKKHLWLAMVAAGAIAAFLSAIAVQGQRQQAAPPAPVTTTEYLLIPASEAGIIPDVLGTIDHDAATARLNEYAAEGWRVRQIGIFDIPAVLLERELVQVSEGAE